MPGMTGAPGRTEIHLSIGIEKRCILSPSGTNIRAMMTAAVDGTRPARGSAIFDFVLVRVVINLVALFGTYIGLQFAVAFVVHRLPKAGHDWLVLTGFAAIAGAMPVLYAALVRLLERRRAGELGFRPALGLTAV